MTISSILTTISRYPGYFFGLSLLPSAADQLVQVIFSKRGPVYITEATSILAAAVSYTFLSHQLSSSTFNIAAPILYLSYKASSYFWRAKQKPATAVPPSSNKTSSLPPDNSSSSPASSTVPFNPRPKKEHSVDDSVLVTKPLPRNSDSAKDNKVEKTEKLVNLDSATPPTLPSLNTSSRADLPPPLVIPQAAEATKAERKKATVERGKLFERIIAYDPRIPLWVMSIQQIPLQNEKVKSGKNNTIKVKKEKFKAQIRFVETHLFKLDTDQVPALNQEKCSVTENTLFFWFELKKKPHGENVGTFNLIPLVLLESLRSTDTTFSLVIKEQDRQFNIAFEGNHLERLKTFAEKIKVCRQIESIPSPSIESDSESSKDILHPLVFNILKDKLRAKCYLEPFMQKI